jgi:hypothetical protein
MSGEAIGRLSVFVRRSYYPHLSLLILITALLLGVIHTSRPRPNDPFRGDALINPPFTSLTYSIQTFLWWDPTWAGVHLDWVRLMVFSHIKQIFAWEDIEPERGRWEFKRADEIVDQVEQKGLKLIVRLSDAPDWSHSSLPGRKNKDFVDAPPDDFADFATFCGQVAARYKGRIAGYQVWNEPNLAREWGGRPPDAGGYVALLRECSRAIHAANPGAVVISAGLSPTGNYDATAQPDDVYLQAMYRSGFQQYVNAVGIHAPGYTAPHIGPDEAQQNGSQRFFTFRRVEDLRKIMVDNGDAAHQVAILEFGWTTDPLHPEYAWFAVTQEQRAQYMVEAYQYAADHWRPWVGLMSVIYISDPSWTPLREEYWWGITSSEGATLPAFFALANMAKYCGDRIIPARAPDSPEAMGRASVRPCD